MEKAGGSLVPIIDDTVRPSKTRKLSGKARVALDALDDAVTVHGIQKQGQDWPSCKVVLLDHWRNSCDRHGLSGSDKPDSKLKAFNRAKDALMEKGLIRVFDSHVWRCFE
jgi:hypothetical protein